MLTCHFPTLRARFTKQGKLSLERNSIEAPMGGKNYACDLLTMCTMCTHRRSQIISIMTGEIYQEQRKLLPALKH